LSRDNVRYDAECWRVLRRAAALVRGPLWEALEARVASAAEDVAGAADVARVALLASLYEAAATPAFERKTHWTVLVPLVDPHEGRRVVTIRALLESSADAIVTADDSSALTRALAANGTMVVRAAARMPSLRPLIGSLPFVDAGATFTYATNEGVTEHPEDDALLGETARLLARTGRSIGRAVLARFEGGPATGARHRVAKTDAKSAVLGHVQHDETPPWSKRSMLFLDVDDAFVRLARRRAKTEPRVAAQLLVRAVLLLEGAIEPRDVDRLLLAAGERG
jgi:hypothetical protein